MPDFQQVTVTPMGLIAGLTVHSFSVSLQVTDSQTGALIHDFTGVNAIQFPQCLTNMTATQRAHLMRTLANDLILMLAGLGVA